MSTVKFIHTSDWQLGMTRRFLKDGGQERFDAARFACLRKIAALCREENCRFVLVAGDVFESNQVSRKTIVRALEAIRDIPAPVILLPGNHDPLDYGSVYRQPAFKEFMPDNLRVLAEGEPLRVIPGVEVVGAPWPAKRLAENPLGGVLADLPAGAEVLRIVLAHGPVDSYGEFPDQAAVIRMADLRKALVEGKAHYVCLGDKHSYACLDGISENDPHGRVYYSGTPEATAFRETDPGWINVVELSPEGAVSRKARSGVWHFHEVTAELGGGADIEELARQLAAWPDKETSVLRLVIRGLLDLAEVGALDRMLAHFADLYAAFEVERGALHSSVDPGDPAWSGYSGFAAAAAGRLCETVRRGDGDIEAARDALLLLNRLAARR